MASLFQPNAVDTKHIQACLQLQRSILNTLPIGITAYDIVGPSDWRLSYINDVAVRIDPNADPNHVSIGKRIEELMPPAAAAQVRKRLQQCIDTGAAYTVEDSYQLTNTFIWTHSTFAPLRDSRGHITGLMTFWENITERKLRELEERQRQEEIIQQQRAVMAELSTPILAISEATMVMPLIGAVDSQRVQQLLDTLLAGVADNHATNVILDITGVPVVDTQVANAFVRAAQAVNLLGCRVVLTGIRPEVAQTLVGLGVDLRSITTRGTLRDGIAYALQNEHN